MTNPPPLWIVDVADHRDKRLAGDRADYSYSSPPQPLHQALELIAVVLDAKPAVADHGPWRRAIAGGSREVRLHPSQVDEQVVGSR